MTLDEAIDAYREAAVRLNLAGEAHDAAREQIEKTRADGLAAVEAFRAAGEAYYDACQAHALNRGTPIPVDLWVRDWSGEFRR
jgi:hypothetical protein